MIVSHKYRFIFLRTEKTASTSLMKALESILGENDMQADMERPSWAKFSPIHHNALRRHAPQWFGLHTHATASQVRQVVGRKIFDSYYKFSVERNPWDRQISLYAHRKWKKGQLIADFDRDMGSIVFRNTSYVRLNNWSNYAIGRDIVADRIIRYERLAEEIAELGATLGFPGPLDLPVLRRYTTDRPHYSTYYGPASRNLVAKWYAREIDALGYSFERQDSAAQRPSAAVLADRPARIISQGVMTTGKEGIAGDEGLLQPGQAIAYGARKAGGLAPAQREMAG
jgi:Sulfotransferase family